REPIERLAAARAGEICLPSREIEHAEGERGASGEVGGACALRAIESEVERGFGFGELAGGLMDVSYSDLTARLAAAVAVLAEQAESLLIQHCRFSGLPLHDRAAPTNERLGETAPLRRLQRRGAALLGLAGGGERLPRGRFRRVPLAETLVTHRDHVQQRRRFTRIAQLSRFAQQLLADGDRLARRLAARGTRALAHPLEAEYQPVVAAGLEAGQRAVTQFLGQRMTAFELGELGEAVQRAGPLLRAGGRGVPAPADT